MKILFISALEFGYKCIEKVLDNGWNVVGIFTREDESIRNASGYVSFDGLSKKYGVPVFKTKDINSGENVAKIKDLEPNVIFVLGWSQIVSNEVIEIPKLACIGHHPTMLPKHRGNAPIPWSIIMGLSKSGVTFFHLTDEVDAGDIFAQKEFEITLEDDAYSVYKKAIDASVSLLSNEILPKLDKGIVIHIPQDEKRASYLHRRKPRDGLVDWNMRTINLYNWIRGLTHPYPGAFTYLSDKKLFIWKAELLDSYGKLKYEPGEIVEIGKNRGLVIRTWDGYLLITKVQVENDDEIEGEEFCRLYGIKVGTILG